MKRKNIFLFTLLIVWVSLCILNFLAPKKEFSNQENRYLADFPKLNFSDHVEGKLTPKIDEYINDHFIFRDKWVYLKSTFEMLLGKKQNNNVYIGKDGYLFERFNEYDLDYPGIDRTCQIINNFSNKLGNNVNIYSMIVPNSIYIYKDKLPKYAEVANQKELIEYIYNNLSSTKNINVIDILEQNKDKGLYFKTDHHINTKGAYYAYKKMCEEMNLEFYDISKYTTKIVSKEFYGTFQSKANIVFTKPDIIDILENDSNVQIEKATYDKQISNSIYNYRYLQEKDKYSFFLNGNNAFVSLKTSVKNDKKLLVVKDSYAHIFAQFLVQNYEEIYFIDPRYSKESISDIIIKNDVDDVLFLYNVSNFVNDLGIKTIK